MHVHAVGIMASFVFLTQHWKFFQSIHQTVCRTEVMFAKNTAACTVAFSITHPRPAV